ncbi:hypothetical protein PCASD_08234 [Puccinia coronata f. sp. avenae]|uniref:Uncharacterized protein n=1 Tax=Puccinia coronata f. sp. avenae TaxID=200324 RepID=A0A2N5ULF5_9BASI|nr:hypothetical protein PCASD_08234 [Puccinia coronata f. sp. avenae]
MPPPASLHPPPGGGELGCLGCPRRRPQQRLRRRWAGSPGGFTPWALGPTPVGISPVRTSNLDSNWNSVSRTIDIKPDHRHQADQDTLQHGLLPTGTAAHTRFTELYKQPMNPLIRPSVSRARQRLDEDWFGWRDETTRSCRSSHAG